MRARVSVTAAACLALVYSCADSTDGGPPVDTAASDAGDATTSGSVDGGDGAKGAVPQIVSFTAASTKVLREASTTITATFSGGEGVVDNGVGVVRSGVPVPTPALNKSTTFSLVVTSSDGSTASATLTVDVKAELFVSVAGPPAAIHVFDDDVTDPATPKRTISGNATTFANDLGLYVSDDEIFVANFSASSIDVFDAKATGNVAPKRSIIGSSTTLFRPVGVFVEGGEVFVGDDTAALKVWNVADTGDVMPKRTITGTASGLAKTTGTWVDGTDLYVGDLTSRKVAVYPRGASGNAAPLRTFAVPGGDGAVGVLVRGNELFVMDGYGNSVTVYDKVSTAQLRRIVIAGATGDYVGQCALVANDLLCGEYVGNLVAVIPANANGTTAPSRTLSGFTKALGVFVR